jgi:hypothetical protein
LVYLSKKYASISRLELIFIILVLRTRDKKISSTATGTAANTSSPDLHHKPKPWKEYLLEGLMIFIAVTMGFIVESIRENISAREKENEFTYGLACLGSYTPSLPPPGKVK